MKLPNWLRAVLLVGIVLLAYQPVWHAGFIWDDHSHVENNPTMFGPGGLKRIWFSLGAPQYYPMVFSSFWLERIFWGTNPAGYHWVNLLLHAGNALLIWRLLRRLRVPGAWLGAALFALHPVNVETAAWITERKNTLAMFFFLVSLCCYLRSEQRTTDHGPRSKGRGRAMAGGVESSGDSSGLYYGVSLVAFVLALLSKTAVAPLGGVLLGLGWWQRGQIGRRDLLRSVPFFVLALLLVPITILVERHTGSGIVRVDGLWARLAGAGWAFWFYLYKAVWPLNLVFVYPRWRIDPSNWLVYLPGLMAVGMFLFFWRFRRGWGRGWLAALGYFAVMLGPALGLVNIYFMRYSLVSDHWTYFALIGPMALAGGGIARGLERFRQTAPWLEPVACGLLLLAAGTLTWRQSTIYVDEETLWKHTLSKNPDCWMAHCNLGAAFAAQGKLEEAIAEYREALRLEPNFTEAHNNLANELVAQGKPEEAIPEFERALQLEPRYPDAHNNLAVQLARQGRVAEAIQHWEEAIRLLPGYAEAEYNLALTLARQGRTDEAVQHFQRALQLATVFGMPGLIADSSAQLEKYLPGSVQAPAP